MLGIIPGTGDTVVNKLDRKQDKAQINKCTVSFIILISAMKKVKQGDEMG